MRQQKQTEPQITALLQAWSSGDEAALNTLIPLIYNDLRQAAVFFLADESAADTYQPTALVHAVYLRLVSGKKLHFENRHHFFRHMALIMRRLLVEHARARLSQKRGSGEKPLPLDGEALQAPAQKRDPEQVIDLDRALAGLRDLNPQKHAVFEMWFFAGIGPEEMAHVFGKSAVSIRRDLRTAKQWLAYELRKHQIHQRENPV